MSDDLSQYYLERAEMLKNMLVSCATGVSCDSADYASIRHELMGVSEIADKLPRFIKTCRNLQEFWDYIQPKFAHYRERRQFIRDEFEPLLAMLEAGSKSPADRSITEQMQKIDSAHVQQAWKKALGRRAADPDGAITAARTLLESVCKHVLDVRGVGYGDSPDLPKLFNLVAKELRIAPSQQTEEILKRIAGGCSSVVEGLGALRNKLGDSHGKSKAAIIVDSRHAHLAVNLAGTLAVYLIETWEATK